MDTPAQPVVGPFEKVLVIGFGGASADAPGAGALVVEALTRGYRLTDNVEVVAAASPDVDLLDAMEDAAYVIAVDHVYGTGEPGAWHRTRLHEYTREEEVPEAVHENSLLEALGVLELIGQRPPGVLVAVEVGEPSPGGELPKAVVDRLPQLAEVVAVELRRVGVPVSVAGRD